MSDFTLPPAQTLIVGMTGSGKTTFALAYLANAPAACRFIFDDLGRAATRLGIRPCLYAHDLEAALATRWVVFNPHRMFPGAPAEAFRFFCRWVYDTCQRGPGKKLVLVDEVWQWQNQLQIPQEFALVVQTGREENIELVSCTQLPHRVNAAVTGQATELVCFRLNEPKALERIGDLGADRERVQALPLGSFISWNRVSAEPDRNWLAGQVF